MKSIPVLSASVATLMIGLIPMASATPPESIEIETTPGSFTSNLPGCPSGTWQDELLHITGNFDKIILNIKVDKTLTCATGDEIVIRFLPKARGVPFPQSGPWTIREGTLAGQDVHGSGWMTVDVDGGPPQELFTGKIHIG